MRQATIPTVWVSTVLATLTGRFMVLAVLVALQTQLVCSVSAEVTFLNTWGSEGTGDGEFGNPYGITLSDTGQVYVTDRENHRIQRFDADGNYELQWGSYGSGHGAFDLPYGITLSDTGQAYVTDRLNHRIQRFDADGNYQLQWGGNGSGDGEFNSPYGITLSGTGQVYVTDASNHRIQRFDADGNYQMQWGGNGSGDGEFSYPWGVALSGTGQVYVTDFYNDRIQRFDAEGNYQLQWGGAGSGDGEFSYPSRIAISPTGQVYVTDAGNHRIQRFFDSEAWVSGTNTFVNGSAGPTSVAVGPGDILGTSLTLDASKGLVVGDTTTVNAGGTLSVSGGSLTTSVLNLNGSDLSTGTLNVTDGGVVTNTSGTIGYAFGSIGEATVTGSDSQWNSSSYLYVGNSGTGTLNVTDGGVVVSMGGRVSRYSTSQSVATVTGSGSHWNTTTSMHVGYMGVGTLNVSDGGMVTSTNGSIGSRPDASGTATVTGGESRWDNSGDLAVGDDGDGTLNIEDQGLVTVGGATSIGAGGSVNLAGGRFEFGQATLAEFSTINATSGSMAGNLPHAGYTDVATLTALQNGAVELTEVTLTNSGVLYGEASMGNALINTAQGEVEVVAGERMRFGGSANTNAGEINNFGGMVRFGQDLTNQSSGFIGGRDTFFRFGGGLTNAGEIGLSVGLHDILGSIANTATGRIMVAGQSTATFYGDVANNGDIFTGQGSQSVFFGEVTGSGSFPGTGNVEFAGSISPGNSPGAVSFGGDVVLGATATTLMELAGVTDGDYDQLQVAGILEVGGDLAVELLDGFVPAAETNFQIFDAGTLSGTFSAVLLPDLPGMLDWDSSHLYSGGTLSVIPEPATLPLLALGMLLAWGRRTPERCERSHG